MAKHGLEGASVVKCFMPIFTVCRVYVHQNGSGRYFFNLRFSSNHWGFGWKKGSLAHGQTRFGMRSCCSVICVNLHKLPCILYASKWLRGYLFFTFLWLLGFKFKKGSLEHGKTLFGRHFSCCVTCVTLHRLASMCIKMAAASFYNLHFSSGYCNVG